MSNMSGMGYLHKLLQDAQKRQAEEATKRQRLQIQERVDFVRGKDKPQTNRPINQTAVRPRDRYGEEQDFRDRPTGSSNVSSILSAAKNYAPLSTTKTEEQLRKPLLTLADLKSGTGQSIKLDITKQKTENDFLSQLESARLKTVLPKFGGGNAWNARRKHNSRTAALAASEEYQQNLALYNTLTESDLGKKFTTKASGFQSHLPATLNQTAVNKAQQNWDRLSTLHKNYILPLEADLGTLITEQETYFGKNFSNLSKEQLAASDWTSINSLSADIEKHTSLRDSYITKYKSDPSKYNSDWIKTYSDAIRDTAKSMRNEFPKIFSAATSSVEKIKSTQGSTLATIEAINKWFGNNDPEQVARKRESKDVAPENRQQLLSRIDRVGTAISKGVKPAPKFEVRPF